MTRIVNCGALDGPCIGREHEDNSRDASWAGGGAEWATIGGAPSTVRYHGRYPVVEGDLSGSEGVDVVRYGVLTLPFMFDSFETGDTRMWSSSTESSEKK